MSQNFFPILWDNVCDSAQSNVLQKNRVNGFNSQELNIYKLTKEEATWTKSALCCTLRSGLLALGEEGLGRLHPQEREHEQM